MMYVLWKGVTEGGLNPKVKLSLTDCEVGV